MTDYVLKLNGLKYNVRVSEIRDFFKEVTILKIKILNCGGRGTGEAFVKFKTFDDYMKALKLDKKYIGNRWIKLKPSTDTEMYQAITNLNKINNGLNMNSNNNNTNITSTLSSNISLFPSNNTSSSSNLADTLNNKHNISNISLFPSNNTSSSSNLADTLNNKHNISNISLFPSDTLNNKHNISNISLFPSNNTSNNTSSYSNLADTLNNKHNISNISLFPSNNTSSFSKNSSNSFSNNVRESQSNDINNRQKDGIMGYDSQTNIVGEDAMFNFNVSRYKNDERNSSLKINNNNNCAKFTDKNDIRDHIKIQGEEKMETSASASASASGSISISHDNNVSKNSSNIESFLLPVKTDINDRQKDGIMDNETLKKRKIAQTEQNDCTQDVMDILKEIKTQI